MAANETDRQFVISYLKLRKWVGLLGVLLPIVLPLGVAILGTEAVVQESISDYVDTVMRGVLVGVLFAIGVFLYSYVGYAPSASTGPFVPSDDLAGNLACVFAIGVALFPTSSGSGLVRTIHFLSAAALFLTLAYFSLYQFTKTSGDLTAKKQARNTVYRIAGWTILVSIALIALYGWLLRDSSLDRLNPVFWLESIALWAFGWAWFVKGEGLKPLNDG